MINFLYEPVYVMLALRAGVMACPEGKTKEGLELQFGTNHIGHFLLIQLLKDVLLKSSTPSFQSRVVCPALTSQSDMAWVYNLLMWSCVRPAGVNASACGWWMFHCHHVDCALHMFA
jgi:NAD(P)-dependent dehydrogenase (short-subunit alcohol dehydrogenase family)